MMMNDDDDDDDGGNYSFASFSKIFSMLGR